jgi:hypothetical protein
LEAFFAGGQLISPGWQFHSSPNAANRARLFCARRSILAID